MEPAIEKLITELPDREAARRFLDALAEKHAAAYEKLKKNAGLLSDVATLAAFSPLLATTLLQNPDYLWWLNRKRKDSGVRGKDDLLESLARFSLTNSQLEPQILFARFRRRELLRIYLRDIRRLATIAEITEEISNLADAILESALKLARREMDNRYGTPQQPDEKGRLTPARFCITALGKLGSRELNYSSDIDLLFLYSAEGTTFGVPFRVPALAGSSATKRPAEAGTQNAGTQNSLTNREYFVKLAQYVTKLVGEPSGEGGAYRVDLRLRPHGTLGSLALSVDDTVRYCESDARAWERQVLIRSRGCAGDIDLFKDFFARVEDRVFSKEESTRTALENVRRSKEKIDLENINRRGFNVKLGAGGIREIEFLAQALQLAHGGRDKWLRSPHTLISLSRLTDRKHIGKSELTELSNAYEFLRRTEHVLQMENGLQTHTVPDDGEKRAMLARRISFAGGGDFERDIETHSRNVSRVFARVFEAEPPASAGGREVAGEHRTLTQSTFPATRVPPADAGGSALSPHFASMLAAHPQLAAGLPGPDEEFVEPDYASEMIEAVESENDFGGRLSAMRQTWSRFLLEIVVADINEKITIREAKRLQTNLAEASIAAALRVTADELLKSRKLQFAGSETGKLKYAGLDIAILALGKLGGRGLDYDSDLDLIIAYFDPKKQIGGVTPVEYYSHAVEIFSTTLSSMTRDGSLYRVDLRLRPFGSKGLAAISIDSFLEYMSETAAIWEMLAFVKLRMAGGDPSLGRNVEIETRRIIHKRAAAIAESELKDETRRVRLALEKQRARPQRGWPAEFGVPPLGGVFTAGGPAKAVTPNLRAGIDIKYGPGGMLDIYFAMRYLQLRYNVPDDANDRSTPFMLERLKSAGALLPSIHAEMVAGYEFLSTLDHNLRLTVGRITRVPLANNAALTTIAARMKLSSPADLLEQLTFHRLAIRNAFDSILSVNPR